MAAEITLNEIRDAAIVLTVADAGDFHWSTDLPDEKVAEVLERIAAVLRADEAAIGDFDCCIPTKKAAS